MAYHMCTWSLNDCIGPIGLTHLYSLQMLSSQYGKRYNIYQAYVVILMGCIPAFMPSSLAFMHVSQIRAAA